MPQFVTGMGRITLTYTIDGLIHKARAYCKQPAPVGATYNITNRSGTPAIINWTAAADDFATSIANLLATGATPSPAMLEQFDGLIWQPLAFHAIAWTPAGSSSQVASQSTTVIRDVSNKKLKVVVLEGHQVPPTHFTSTTQGTGGYQNFLKEWLNGSFTLTNAPYLWATSHRELFISPAGAFVGSTVTLNRRIRRRRGLT